MSAPRLLSNSAGDADASLRQRMRNLIEAAPECGLALTLLAWSGALSQTDDVLPEELAVPGCPISHELRKLLQENAAAAWYPEFVSELEGLFGAERSSSCHARLARCIEERRLHLQDSGMAQALLKHCQAAAQAGELHRLACELSLRHLENGRNDEAASLRERACAVLSEAGFESESASPHLLRLDAFQALLNGDASLGLGLLKLALEQCGAAGDVLMQGRLNCDFGNTLMQLGLLQEALQAFDRSERQLRECGAERSRATVLANIGILWHRSGRLSQARRMYEQSLATALHLADRRLELNARQYLGKLLLDMGRTELAREEYAAALELAREQKSPGEQAIALEGLGNVARVAGENGTADAFHSECLVVCEEHHIIPQHIRVNIHFARHAISRQDFDNAARYIEKVKESIDFDSHLEELAQLQLLEGEFFLSLGRSQEAVDMFSQAVDLFDRLNDQVFHGVALCRSSLALVQTGNMRVAQDMFVSAQNLFALLQSPNDLDFYPALQECRKVFAAR